MKTVKIKPAHKDLIVRDPETRRPLAARGEEKPLNAYWARRLQAGDCVLVNDKKKGG